MNRTLFMVKKTYTKAVKKLMTAEDKIDFAIVNINEQIVKLGDARTAFFKIEPQTAKTKATIKDLETKIIALNDKKKEIEGKKQEYIAKVSMLNAEKDAMVSLSKCGMEVDSVDSIMKELDDDIKTLEAELNTAEFIAGIK